MTYGVPSLSLLSAARGNASVSSTPNVLFAWTKLGSQAALLGAQKCIVADSPDTLVYLRTNDSFREKSAYLEGTSWIQFAEW
jgi:hypothetical protein